MNEAFILIFLVVGGIFSILGALYDWDFFFNNRKAQSFVQLFGRKGARIFYFILGTVLLIIATYIYFLPKEP